MFTLWNQSAAGKPSGWAIWPVLDQQFDRQDRERPSQLSCRGLKGGKTASCPFTERRFKRRQDAPVHNRRKGLRKAIHRRHGDSRAGDAGMLQQERHQRRRQKRQIDGKKNRVLDPARRQSCANSCQRAQGRFARPRLPAHRPKARSAHRQSMRPGPPVAGCREHEPPAAARPVESGPCPRPCGWTAPPARTNPAASEVGPSLRRTQPAVSSRNRMIDSIPSSKFFR